jgi:hypothetical protein
VDFVKIDVALNITRDHNICTNLHYGKGQITKLLFINLAVSFEADMKLPLQWFWLERVSHL